MKTRMMKLNDDGAHDLVSTDASDHRFMTVICNSEPHQYNGTEPVVFRLVSLTSDDSTAS